MRRQEHRDRQCLGKTNQKGAIIEKIVIAFESNHIFSFCKGLQTIGVNTGPSTITILLIAVDERRRMRNMMSGIVCSRYGTG